MHRQQVLKCRLSDRFVTACDRLCQISKKSCHAGSQCLCGFERDRFYFKTVTKLSPTCHITEMEDNYE